MMPIMAKEHGRNDDNDHAHDERSIGTKKENIVTAVYLYLFYTPGTTITNFFPATLVLDIFGV